MKRVKKDICGYYYAEVTKEEVKKWGGLGICDSCGYPIFNKSSKGYLIWVLSGCWCEECFIDWQKRNISYEEDLKLQKRHSKEYYQHYLGKEIEFDE